MSAARKIAQPTLAERIEQTRAECEAFIDKKVAELKATDGKKLPVDVIRLTLVGPYRCACHAAEKLLMKEAKR